MKLFSKNRLFISLLSSTLSSAFLVTPSYGMLPEDEREASPTRTISLSLCEMLGNDSSSREYYIRALTLFYSNNPEDKEIGAAAFREMAANSAHPYYSSAIQTVVRLFKYGNKEDTKVAREPLIDILKDSTHSQYLSALLPLVNGFDEEAWQKAGLPEDLLLNVSPALFLDKGLSHEESFDLVMLLRRMLKSPNPNVQEKAESIFFNAPLQFMNDGFLSASISGILLEKEENKKCLFLQRLCQVLETTSLEIETTDAKGLFEAAYLVLQASDEERFVTPAKKVFLNLMDKQLVYHIHDNLRDLSLISFLRFLKDVDLRQKIISHLFNLTETLVESINTQGSSTYIFNVLNEKENSLLVLLQQDDEEIQNKALALCQKLLGIMDLTQAKNIKLLSSMGLLMNKSEEGKELTCQIVTMLEPAFDDVFSDPDSDPWDGHTSLVNFFMQEGHENHQVKIFNFLKESIINVEDKSSTGSESKSESDSESDSASDSDSASEAESDIRDGIDIIIESLGTDHPWSQELIELATKRANMDNPHSIFSLYKHLRAQMDQPVDHHLPQFQLEDGRFVTFNLKTLQTRRKSFFIPLKHTELVGFTTQLVVEANTHPEAFKTFAVSSLTLDPQSALEEVNTVFFKNLLDPDGEAKNTQNVSLTSFKLRRILTAAKELQGQEGKEKETLDP